MTGGSATPVPGGPSVATFWALVEHAATAFPDHGVLADDHGRVLTGAGLRDAAATAAAGLADAGVRMGSRVSWQLPSTLEALVVTAALSRLGAVQHPIVPVLRAHDVAFTTRQFGTEHLLVPEEWRGFDHGAMARDLAASDGVRIVICDHATDPATVGGSMRLPVGDPSTLAPPPTDDGERWCYYSSGTTAEPKGIRHTDQSVMASANAVMHGLATGPADVFPMAIPMAHIGGVGMLTAALMSGMRVVVFDTWDPASTPQRMAAHRPTILGSAVPFFLAYIAAQQRHGGEPLFPALRTGVAGGAPLPPEVNRSVREALGIRGICNSWGLTEFPIVTSPTPDDPIEVLDSTVGRPGEGVSVRAVDADGDEVPAGTEGELRVKGPQCFRGYVDATLDAAAFDADGWLRTGDLGMVDADGRVRVTGRLKDVIIRNAENISALEVEDVLLRCPGVTDVAVIGVPDPKTVERVCAVVVVAGGATVTLDDVIAHCRGEGTTPYKIPERLEVVDVIPRNAMGKILKNDLRARFT